MNVCRIFVVIVFLASFLMLSCGYHGLQMPEVHDAHACHEHSIVSSINSPGDLLGTGIFVGAMNSFPAFTLFVFILFLPKPEAQNRLPQKIVYRRRFLFWLWARSLPFVTLRLFLPYFAAERDT